MLNGLGKSGRDQWLYSAPVGSFPANPFGLYDMSGNVWEWCADWKESYDVSVSRNPKGPETGSSRLLRGGSWGYTAKDLRSADRGSGAPAFRLNDIGFRCALTVRQN